MITKANGPDIGASAAQGPAEIETTAAPTRERLVAAAVRLFADQGYEGTSVGEIEAAAGLVPRRGALYRHFDSKRALIGAALEERSEAVERIGAQLAELGGTGLEDELRAVAEVALSELARERELARLVMKEGDRFPDLARDFHAAVVDSGHRLGRAWLGARAHALGRDLDDPDATSQVLVDAMVGYALQEFMFGAVAEPFDRERFLAGWVRLGLTVLQPAEGDRP